MTQVVWFGEEKERKVLFAGGLFVCFPPQKEFLICFEVILAPRFLMLTP